MRYVTGEQRSEAYVALVVLLGETRTAREPLSCAEIPHSQDYDVIPFAIDKLHASTRLQELTEQVGREKTPIALEDVFASVGIDELL